MSKVILVCKFCGSENVIYGQINWREMNGGGKIDESGYIEECCDCGERSLSRFDESIVDSKIVDSKYVSKTK